MDLYITREIVVILGKWIHLRGETKHQAWFLIQLHNCDMTQPLVGYYDYVSPPGAETFLL